MTQSKFHYFPRSQARVFFSHNAAPGKPGLRPLSIVDLPAFTPIFPTREIDSAAKQDGFADFIVHWKRTNINQSSSRIPGAKLQGL